MKKTRIILLLVLFVSAQVFGAPPEFEDLREFINQGIEERRAPSVAVAAVRNGELIWAEGFGHAEIETETPATADSIYLLASVSKPMAATGLMVLADRGLIDLDQPANDYLPGNKLRAYRGSADEMTVRRLANHSAGMAIHYNFYYNAIQPPSREETIRQYGFSYNPPGSRWEYCNLAFGVVDYILECVSAMPWGKFMEENVYDPIGMTHTSNRVRPGLEEHATAQYVLDSAGRFLRVGAYGFDHDAASANWSSARDLARFLRLHLNDGAADGTRVLKEESAQAMRRLSFPRNPARPDEGNGIAWFVGDYQGHASFSHSGGMPGVSTQVRGFPEHRAGWVVLINANAHAFRGEIERRLTKSLLPEAEPRQRDARTVAAEANPSPTNSQRADFAGIWEGKLVHFDGDIPVRLEVNEDESVQVRLGAGASVALANASFSNGRLTGNISARIKTQPSYHGMVRLDFRLEQHRDELAGVAVAFAQDYFALSHYVELKKTEDRSNEAGEQTAGSAAAGPDSDHAFDLLIQGGRIVDGSGAPWYRGDVAVRDGRIAKIGRIETGRAERVIDAEGLVVAPGFIDMMGQTASPFLTNREAGNNLFSQGITTILTGEGVSAAPLSDSEARERGWQTMSEYFARLEQNGLPVNVAQTVGHTQVRRIVIGNLDRAPAPDEFQRMKDLVREAMEAGAIGVSTALIYPPAIYASTDEIAGLCRVAGEYGGRYYTHMRNEGDQFLEAIDEALDIGAAGGTPVHIFHLKAAGRANWGKMDQALARIQAARASGQEVDADVYPYTNNGLGLQAFIHPRHFADGPQEFWKKIQNGERRAEMRREMEEEGGWENWFRHVGSDWSKVVLGNIRTERHRSFNGQSVAAIAHAQEMDAWDLFWEILKGGGAFALPQSMSEANLIKAMRAEFVSFCTDVGPAGGSRIASHPRAYGSFPRILSRYVRELGVISLEEAVRKMSATAANQILAYDRGRLAEGLAADIVLFDFENIADRATFAQPNQTSEGVRYVLVNGTLVFDKGGFTGALPGRVLRGPGYVAGR